MPSRDGDVHKVCTLRLFILAVALGLRIRLERILKVNEGHALILCVLCRLITLGKNVVYNLIPVECVNEVLLGNAKVYNIDVVLCRALLFLGELDAVVLNKSVNNEKVSYLFLSLLLHLSLAVSQG